MARSRSSRPRGRTSQLTAGIRIGVRADGGREIGLGHLARCLSLAKAFDATPDVDCRFYVHEDGVGARLVADGGRRVEVVQSSAPTDVPEGDDLLIVDLPGGVALDYVHALRQRDPGRLVALFDATCEGRLGADVVVAPIRRLPDTAWQGFQGSRHEGPKYAILDPAFTGLPPRSLDGGRTPRILVTMGGADPFGLTIQALEALESIDAEFETDVALGPAFSNHEQVDRLLGHARRRYSIQRVPVLANLMVTADIALCSFGTSVYELAAAGLPAIALSITPDHAQAAELFARHGSLISAGLYSKVTHERVGSMVRELLSDPPKRLAMGTAGQALVDGQGARRVADLLLSAIAKRSST